MPDVKENSPHPLKFIRGETRSRKFIYRPRDKTLPPFNITGLTVEMRIKPHGQSEIVYTASPGISITNGAGGEITIDPSGAMVAAYAFQHAPYVVLLNGKRLFYGELTVDYLYER